MTADTKLLAKPSGITLEQHTQDVMSEGKSLLERMPFVLQKYREKVGKDLARRLELVCQYHDVGKKEPRWQSACRKDYENFFRWQQQHKGEGFENYEQKEGKKVGQNIRHAKVRHEFWSLKHFENKEKGAPLALLTAIAAHHGKLGYAFDKRWEEQEGWAKKLWKRFRKESNDVIEGCSIGRIAQKHYEFAGVRGLLRLSDHRASAKESGELIPDLTSFQYTFPHAEKRGVQCLIEEHWQEDLLLLRASTGAGKTDAALLWASQQIKNGRAERLVITMPTRFTSNALAISVSETLSDTGLYHSSAWNVDRFEGKGKETVTKRHELSMARLLQTPVTVCTIDHLLMALTLTREDHHLITFNLANACLVIDEADFYDEFTQANILILLEMLKYWNVPILLMSASLPNSVVPLYQKIGYQTKEIIEDISDNDRIRFEIKRIVKYSDISEIEEFLNLCIEKETAIIYINTVDKAILFYDWFNSKLQAIEKKKDIPLFLYHSRFTEPDKKAKEKELISALGKDAYKNGKAKGIAILTQIGEMSVNISADIMISELCPIDRLSQRTGRMCRFDKEKCGELFVLIPFKDETIYPAPYGEFDIKEKKWIPCKAYEKTREVIEETTPYTAARLVELINHVYVESINFSTKAKDNSKKLKEYFKYNWLINSKQLSTENDSDTTFWKSRDIPLQDTVFVRKPKSEVFRSFLDYQSWKMQYSVEIPLSLLKKGKDNHMVDCLSIYYSEYKENIYVVKEGFYSQCKGLSFKEEGIYM